MSDSKTVQLGSDERSVFTDVCEMISVVLDGVGYADIEIGMESRILADLGMQSIDLAELSVHLEDHYGEQVNFAEIIGGLDVDVMNEMTVGKLVAHITHSLVDIGER